MNDSFSVIILTTYFFSFEVRQIRKNIDDTIVTDDIPKINSPINPNSLIPIKYTSGADNTGKTIIHFMITSLKKSKDGKLIFLFKYWIL